MEASDKSRRGGIVYVYATQSLGSKGRKWLDLEYGLGFQVRPGGNRSLAPFTYANVYGQGFRSAGIDDLYREQLIPFGALADPERLREVEAQLLKLIRKSAGAAARLSIVTREGRSALRRI